MFGRFVISSHFDGPIIVFIGNENMTVFKKFSGIRTVELVSHIGIRAGEKLPDDMFLQIDFNNPAVALVGDEHMRIGKPGVWTGALNWSWPIASQAKLSVLPDDMSGRIHQVRLDYPSHHRCLGMTPGGVPVPPSA